MCYVRRYLYRAGKNEKVIIRLSGKEYTLDRPFAISNQIVFKGNHANPITINTGKILSAFVINGNGHLTLEGVNINGSGVQATHFISSDTSGSSHHYNLLINGCTISGLDRNNGCEDLFHAFKSMVADSIVIRNSYFSGNNAGHIIMNEEKNDRGYYNAEKIILHKNTFTAVRGMLLDIYRGGNDESTLGPKLSVTGNTFTNCSDVAGRPFIQLTGVQKTKFINNIFRDCFPGNTLFVYKDIVRAEHLLENNTFSGSGDIQPNEFVVNRDINK